ncbi:ferritin subunit [Anoplophora glabripennis]|uniref:Ferritin n=1 Tax=Anoplophora glabripennis TaxID=217634 RepID=V5GNT8_ANOGL|nr:ferritin subunit [Anoplophora glabripennis]
MLYTCKMKSFVFTVFVICCAVFTSAELECRSENIHVPTEWIDMKDFCVNSMRGQIEEELKAAMQYMAMGAHFSKDIVNKPGFAKTFFEAASEERQHAIKLISYLLMRGELTSKVSELIKSRKLIPTKTSWPSGLEALKDALKLEASVTQKIRKVIKVCEDDHFNDYHLVDYLTGDFLTEQYHGQRDIAGKVSTLEKLKQKHGALGEFLFDKKLLNGEL